MFKDSLFKKIEDKSGVDKDTIISLADKLQHSNMRDEGVLRDLVHELSSLTGRDVSREKEDKIISTILKDQVPKDIDKMI